MIGRYIWQDQNASPRTHSLFRFRPTTFCCCYYFFFFSLQIFTILLLVVVVFYLIGFFSFACSCNYIRFKLDSSSSVSVSYTSCFVLLLNLVQPQFVTTSAPPSIAAQRCLVFGFSFDVANTVDNDDDDSRNAAPKLICLTTTASSRSRRVAVVNANGVVVATSQSNKPSDNSNINSIGSSCRSKQQASSNSKQKRWTATETTSEPTALTASTQYQLTLKAMLAATADNSNKFSVIIDDFI